MGAFDCRTCSLSEWTSDFLMWRHSTVINFLGHLGVIKQHY